MSSLDHPKCKRGCKSANKTYLFFKTAQPRSSVSEGDHVSGAGPFDVDVVQSGQPDVSLRANDIGHAVLKQSIETHGMEGTLTSVNEGRDAVLQTLRNVLSTKLLQPSGHKHRSSEVEALSVQDFVERNIGLNRTDEFSDRIQLRQQGLNATCIRFRDQIDFVQDENIGEFNLREP